MCDVKWTAWPHSFSLLSSLQRRIGTSGVGKLMVITSIFTGSNQCRTESCVHFLDINKGGVDFSSGNPSGPMAIAVYLWNAKT